MRAPITTTKKKETVDGVQRSFFYIETDYRVTNLKASAKQEEGFYKVPYGSAVFYKYVAPTDDGPFARADNLGLYLWNTKNNLINIGPMNAPSRFCGADSTTAITNTNSKVDSTPTGGRQDWNPSTTTTTTKTTTFGKSDSGINSPPTLELRNLVLMRLNSNLQDQGISIEVSGKRITDINATGLIGYFNAALDNPNDTNKLIRFFAGTGNIDAQGRPSSEIIRTMEDLVAKFPGYFAQGTKIDAQQWDAFFGGNRKLTYTDGKVYPEGYALLWKSYISEGLNEETIRQKLKEKGFSQQQIQESFTAANLNFYEIKKLSDPTYVIPGIASLPGSSGGGGGGGANPGTTGGPKQPDGTPWYGPQGYTPGQISTLTVQRSRNIFLDAETQFAQASKERGFTSGQDLIMYQVYVAEDPNGNLGHRVDPYIFKIAPNEVNYNNFGAEWVETARNGSFPYVDWKSFKLLSISFSFLIANRNGPNTADGLDISVMNDIQQLQRMSQAPYPVMFYGFDDLFQQQLRYDAGSTKPRGIQFVIKDLQINAIRRDANMQITRAQASISLQEIPIETTALIGMPRLKHKDTPPPPPPPPNEVNNILATDTLTTGATGTYTYAPFQPSKP